MPTNRDKRSYVVVRHNLAVTPALAGNIVTAADDMVIRSYITVDYYNVRVRSLTDDELKGIIAIGTTVEAAASTKAQQDRLKMGLSVRVKDTVEVEGSETTDTIPETTITGPEPSTVTITGISNKSVTAEQLISTLTVTYRVNEDIALAATGNASNAITITLPADWGAASPASTDADGTGGNSFGTDALTEVPDLSAGEMRSYVMVVDNPYADASPATSKPALMETILTIGSVN